MISRRNLHRIAALLCGVASLCLVACASAEFDSGAPPKPPDPPPPVTVPTVLDGVRSGAVVGIAYYTTPDGAQLPRAFWDRARAQVCEPAADRGGTVRCLPNRFAFELGGWYTDAKCSRALYILDGDCTGTPPLSSTYIKQATGVCARQRIHEAIPYTGELYALSGAGACQPKPLPAQYEKQLRYELGPEVDPAAFPAISLAVGRQP